MLSFHSYIPSFDRLMSPLDIHNPLILPMSDVTKSWIPSIERLIERFPSNNRADNVGRSL
jgi:hypothetical protein